MKERENEIMEERWEFDGKLWVLKRLDDKKGWVRVYETLIDKRGNPYKRPVTASPKLAFMRRVKGAIQAKGGEANLLLAVIEAAAKDLRRAKSADGCASWKFLDAAGWFWTKRSEKVFLALGLERDWVLSSLVSCKVVPSEIFVIDVVNDEAKRIKKAIDKIKATAERDDEDIPDMALVVSRDKLLIEKRLVIAGLKENVTEREIAGLIM